MSVNAMKCLPVEIGKTRRTIVLKRTARSDFGKASMEKYSMEASKLVTVHSWIQPLVRHFDRLSAAPIHLLPVILLAQLVTLFI